MDSYRACCDKEVAIRNVATFRTSTSREGRATTSTAKTQEPLDSISTAAAIAIDFFGFFRRDLAALIAAGNVILAGIR